MQIQPIRTDADNYAAIERIMELIDAEHGTPEWDELDVLSTLVEAYERERYPVDKPDPIRMIKFMLEQKGMTRKDLEPMIGSRARVSEVLNGKRALTLPMIRRLHVGLSIPVDLLIGVDATPPRALRREKKKPASPASRTGRRAAAQQSVR
jgi:HTH-type transcriptional regulator/antitoxin HigA